MQSNVSVHRMTVRADYLRKFQASIFLNEKNKDVEIHPTSKLSKELSIEIDEEK